MLSTFTSYQHIARELDTSLTRKAAERPVARDIDYYLGTIGTITSVDEFVGNTRVFKFAMKAFGLEDMDYAKGLMKRILNEGVEDKKSLANRMADERFVKFAEAFNFAKNGVETTQSTELGQGVVDKYVRQTLEIDAGAENEGVRLALYFAREAPNVESAFGLLGDAALWEVVKTVYGFPAEMANADIDKQKAAVEKRLDMEDLKDPEKLDKLIRRFTAVWDATQISAADPVLDLFTTTSSTSLQLDLVLALHNLKHGGA